MTRTYHGHVIFKGGKRTEDTISEDNISGMMPRTEGRTVHAKLFNSDKFLNVENKKIVKVALILIANQCVLIN